MKILMRVQKESGWKLVESAAYPGEGELQRLLAESPGLISISEIRPEAGPLVLAVPEFSFPIGSADLLAFTAAGDIALLECKLASNPEVKRKVIGQLLEYGAHLWEMSYEDLDQAVQIRLGESLANLVGKAGANPDWDEESFRANVESALASGNFILIIVVDQINEQLSRIVRFINACGSPSFAFAALEMRRFQSEKTEILVPRVFGPVHSPKPSANTPSRQWDEASFFAELQRRNGEAAVHVARSIYDWGNQNLKTWFGRGKQNGSFVTYFFHKDLQHQLFAVYTYGVVETYFYWYATKAPFDDIAKRQEIMKRLNRIEGVNLPQQALNRRPSIPLSVLNTEEKIRQFLDVYEWFVDEVRKL